MIRGLGLTAVIACLALALILFVVDNIYRNFLV